MKILFIEDDPMNRRVVRDMLNVAGVTMIEADCAEEGLRQIDLEDFAVVLTDLRMPGRDGFEVIGTIRALPGPKADLPLIVVTADTTVDLVERCMAIGADAVIFKPVAMDVLFDTIGDVLARKTDHHRMIA